MYEKAIKFKLEHKFFNEQGYLDNKYIYDWLTFSRKYFLNSLGIDIDLLSSYNYYYSDSEIKISIKKNIKYENKDIIINTILQKHSGVKSIFYYEIYVDGEIIVIATSTHSILSSEMDRSIRMDRSLPKWDQILKDVVNNSL